MLQELLKKTLSLIDVLMSGFPAGTVSGAPKIRAMEIIDSLKKISVNFTLVALATFLQKIIWIPA